MSAGTSARSAKGNAITALTSAVTGSDVLVVGVADRVEIWDAAAWAELSEEADQLYAGIEEALSEEGI